MSYKKLPSYLYSKDKNLQYINYLKLKVDSIYAIIEERRIGMEKPKFEFYTRPNGHNEFLEFLESLTESDSDKMFSLIHKIQDSGLLVAQYMQ